MEVEKEEVNCKPLHTSTSSPQRRYMWQGVLPRTRCNWLRRTGAAGVAGCGKYFPFSCLKTTPAHTCLAVGSTISADFTFSFMLHHL
jgi:hypothetical protein